MLTSQFCYPTVQVCTYTCKNKHFQVLILQMAPKSLKLNTTIIHSNKTVITYIIVSTLLEDTGIWCICTNI